MVNKIFYDLKQLDNKHKDKPAIILAHGPSLNTTLNTFKLLNDKDTITFGCNDWYKFYENPPKYWVIANNECNMITEKDIINKYQETLEVIYSDSADTTNRDWIEGNIKAQIYGFDSRHFLSKKCSKKHLRNLFFNLMISKKDTISFCLVKKYIASKSEVLPLLLNPANILILFNLSILKSSNIL